MKAAAILLAAALGVSAHPHGSVHHHVHRNLEVRDQFVKNEKPTSTVFQTVTVQAINNAAIPAATSSAAPAVSSAPASGGNNGGSGTIGSPSNGKYKDDFCTGAPSKRATLDDIFAKGNTGKGKYGCNLKFVDASAAKDYQYISILENVSNKEQTCACFFKIGPTGDVDGFWSGKQALDFKLAAGESKYLAAQADSQGSCSCGPGSTLPVTPMGQIAGIWFEWDFGSERNKGWTGADASSLVDEDYNLPLQGLTITEEGVPGTVSTIYPNGDGCNAFPKGWKNADGLGFNIEDAAPGKRAIRFHAKWGTTGSKSDCPGNLKGQDRGSPPY